MVWTSAMEKFSLHSPWFSRWFHPDFREGDTGDEGTPAHTSRA